MNLDRNSLLAIILCVVFYLLYSQYLNKRYPDYQRRQESAEVTPTTAPTAAAPSTAAPAAVGQTSAPTTNAQDPAAQLPPELSAQERRFSSAQVDYDFDQQSSALTSIRLKNYHPQLVAGADLPLEILDSPMQAQGVLGSDNFLGYRGYHAQRNGNVLTLMRQQDGWEIEQRFIIPEAGYSVKLELSFKNTAAVARELTAGLLVGESPNMSNQKSGGFFGGSFVQQQKSLIYSINGSRHNDVLLDFCKDPEKLTLEKFNLQNEKIDFVGFDMHYFLKVWRLNELKSNIAMRKISGNAQDRCQIALLMWQNYGFINPNDKINLSFNTYLGPKDVEILQNHDGNFKQTVDFGFFGVIAYPLLVALKWTNKYINNFGIAIIILTALLKMLFYPLTKSAAVSMRKMQKLQPEMNALRERYKEDPPKQQKELMIFMKNHNVNPAKGCIPILPQIPVFIAFYNVLSQAIELRHAPFFGWIKDLSAADPYLITPILLTLGMFVQQRLTPTPGMDKTQARIMMMMPIIFGLMMLSMPSGMVIYMITNTIISIAQQQWLNRKLDKIQPLASTNAG